MALWLKQVLPPGNTAAHGADGQSPTAALPLDAWVVQPAGKRGQQRARGQSVATAAAGASALQPDVAPTSNASAPPDPSGPAVHAVSDDDGDEGMEQSDQPATAQAYLAHARTQLAEAEAAVAAEEKVKEKVKKDAARPGWKWIRDCEHKISRREKNGR